MIKHLNWCEKVQSTVKRYHVSQGTCPQKVKNATVITKFTVFWQIKSVQNKLHVKVEKLLISHENLLKLLCCMKTTFRMKIYVSRAKQGSHC